MRGAYLDLTTSNLTHLCAFIYYADDIAVGLSVKLIKFNIHLNNNNSKHTL